MKRNKPWWVRTSDQISPDTVIRFRGQRDQHHDHSWVSEILRALEDAGEKERISRARTCARTRGGSHLIIESGKMRVSVCCAGHTIRDVNLLFPRWNEETINRMGAVIAADAILAGAVLSGDFSDILISCLNEEGIVLIPGDMSGIIPLCTCGEVTYPCIHVAVAWFLLAQVLDEEPWHLFTIRGISISDLIQQVRMWREATPDLPNLHIPSLSGREEPGEDPGIPRMVSREGFFSCNGDGDLPPIPAMNRDVNPVALLGKTAYRWRGRDLAEEVAALYPVIRRYAENLENGKG